MPREIYVIIVLFFLAAGSAAVDMEQGDRMKIVTASGLTYEGALHSASDSSIEINDFASGRHEILRTDIDRVYTAESSVIRGAALGAAAGILSGMVRYLAVRESGESFFKSEIRENEYIHVQATVVLAGIGGAVGAPLEKWTPVEQEEIAISIHTVHPGGVGLQLAFRF